MNFTAKEASTVSIRQSCCATRFRGTALPSLSAATAYQTVEPTTRAMKKDASVATNYCSLVSLDFRPIIPLQSLLSLQARPLFNSMVIPRRVMGDEVISNFHNFTWGCRIPHF